MDPEKIVRAYSVDNPLLVDRIKYETVTASKPDVWWNQDGFMNLETYDWSCC